MKDLPYGFQARLEGTSFDRAVELVTKALADEGFGVITKIDVKETFETKLGVGFRPYVILGACNPALAKRALDVDPHLGLLLPCNVVVEEAPGGAALVSAAAPKAMFSLVDDAGLASVAEEAEQRLRRALSTLGP